VVQLHDHGRFGGKVCPGGAAKVFIVGRGHWRGQVCHRGASAGIGSHHGARLSRCSLSGVGKVFQGVAKVFIMFSGRSGDLPEKEEEWRQRR